jgi:hypothetical protein
VPFWPPRIGGSLGRVPLALAGAVLLAGIATLATCGGCGKRAPGGGDTTAAASAGAEAPVVAKGSREGDAGTRQDEAAWTSARSGEPEDLATLATQEGAVGLVEASSDPELRSVAIEAMAYAWGWAQLPFLAKTAAGKSDDDARRALESAAELAARPRRAEDPEDAAELREGCEGLLALARDASMPRARRVGAVRALRMLPCPPLDRDGGAVSLPADVDAK